MSDTIARGGIEVFAQVDFSDMDRAILQSQAKIGAFNSEFDQMAKKAGGAGKGVADSLKDADAATQRFARSLQLAAAQGQLTVGETALLKASLRGLDTEALRPLAAATRDRTRPDENISPLRTRRAAPGGARRYDARRHARRSYRRRVVSRLRLRGAAPRAGRSRARGAFVARRVAPARRRRRAAEGLRGFSRAMA